MKVSLPEQVWIDLEPASFGSRALAYIIDFLVRWIIVAMSLLALWLFMLYTLPSLALLEWLPQEWSNNSIGVWAVLLMFVIEWSYPIYFEVYRSGISPGKRALGLQVVDEQGLPISFRSSLLRNVLSAVDIILLGLPAFWSMMLTERSQRLGDLVAGTMVVHQPQPVDLSTLAREHSDSLKADTILLPQELYSIIERYIQRRPQLKTTARAATLTALLPVLKQRCPELTVPDFSDPVREGDVWLRELFERARPGKITAARAKRDAALKWEEVHREFEACEQSFNALLREPQNEQTLFETAARYQQLCQRYGYLSTFYPNTAEARHASRLVRLGRNRIYSRRLSATAAHNAPFLERVTAAFGAVASHVLLAGVVGTVSAVLTAMLIQLNPNLVWHFLSEDTAAQLKNGTLWTEGIRGMSGLASSKILTNNISVTLTAFAFGVTGGVGTILVLVFNGAHIGGLFSGLTFYKMAYPLFDFVVAHGFLELSVIIVAGGCGLYLGDALLNPGELSRAKALQRNARAVVDLLLFNALCLVLAGVVEGYISPYKEIPFALKLSIGLALGVWYWCLLATGKALPFSKAKVRRS